MSNTESNTQLDDRLKSLPEQDGVDIHLDHDDACKLFAIALLTPRGVLHGLYRALGKYVDENGGEGDYDVDLSDQSTIKVIKR